MRLEGKLRGDGITIRREHDGRLVLTIDRQGRAMIEFPFALPTGGALSISLGVEVPFTLSD